MAAEPVSAESYPPALLPRAACGIKGHLPAAEHKIPPGHPFRQPCPALETTALKGSVTQGFASLGRRGQEGKDDPIELRGVVASSAKGGFSEC